MFSLTVLCLIVLAVAGYFVARNRATALRAEAGPSMHSLPGYHGAFVAMWVGLPSLVLVLLWVAAEGPLLESIIVTSLPERLTAGASQGQIDLHLSTVLSIANGNVFGTPDETLFEAAERYNTWRATAGWAMFASALALALLMLTVTRARLAAAFRARPAVEKLVSGLMIFCSIVAILTTIGIVASLLFESFRFFERVPLTEFLFGLNWEPQIALREDQVAGQGAFGAIPVFTGTILIALIAMLVAGPIGLFSAIYLAEYSAPRFRTVIKPIMELLAGIPTVVYGFFAVLVVAPALRDFGHALGLDVAPNSAFVAGAVMGIMIIPFVSSLSDDALRAVPRAMRDGSYGLGATQAETIVSVLLPAALPGIIGGFLLAVSRAIGETMIVVMAAGLIANLTANPFEAVTTVTVQIVTLLIGDTEFDSPKTLAAFALGLVLFIVTLILNVVALRIVQKYREKYD